MASVPTDPSVGMDAETGGTITGWDHVLQSLQDIFTTRFGSRVMREYYGSFVPGLLGTSNINRADLTRFFSAVTAAILQWEPRYFVTAIKVSEASRGGSLTLVIEGEYRPRATYGDKSAEGARRVLVGPGASAGQWNVNNGAA